MIGSRRTGRIIGWGMVSFLLVVAACGDDAAADPERFCEISDEVEQIGSVFGLRGDEAREVVGEVRNLIGEGVRVAPDEIRASVDTSADSLTLLLDLFEGADFNFPQVGQADFEAAQEVVLSDEVEAADDAVDAWIEANCSA